MSTPVNELIGANVRRLRLQHPGGLSQVGCAEMLGLALGKGFHPTTMNRLEQGKRPFLVEELVALSRILGVGVTELLADPDPQAYWRTQIRLAEHRVAVARKELAEALAQVVSVRRDAQQAAGLVVAGAAQ